MKTKLPKELLLLKKVVKKDYYEFLYDKYKNSEEPYNVIWLSGQLYRDVKFEKYVNSDYMEFSEYLYEDSKKVKLLEKLKEKINEPIIWYVSNNEQYYFSISIKWYFNIYLSWLLKYYVYSYDKKNKDEKMYIEIIDKFLKQRWYKKLTKELWEVELDIEWEDLHSRERHREVYIKYYYDFCPDDMFCFDGKDWRVQAKDKQEDLELYLTSEYLWKYKVKNLLFWENFEISEYH